MKRNILLTLVVVLAAIALPAQDEKKPEKKAAPKSAILHPEMKVETGSWDAPAAKIGTKPDAKWTPTTYEASVNKTPLAGQVVTKVGEIVDMSCYLQLGKHGEAHRACGQKCVQNGQPAALLTRDGSLYLLMPEEHHPRRDGGVDGRASASEHMGHIVEVTGTQTMHNGYRAIYVQGLTK